MLIEISRHVYSCTKECDIRVIKIRFITLMPPTSFFNLLNFTLSKGIFQTKVHIFFILCTITLL